MNRIVLIVLFALVWLAITGSLTLHNLALGLVLSCLALWLVRGEASGRRRLRPLGIMALVLLFFRELALSAWRVATMVLQPRIDTKPGIFAYPLQVTTDFEITLLANLITLTPGTLSVDVSDDRKLLYVHAIDCSDIEATKRDIANGFERRIMEAFR